MKHLLLGLLALTVAPVLCVESSLIYKRTVPLYEFAESVNIVQSMIQTNSLGSLLAPEHQHVVQALIANLSPAEIAFQAAIIISELPAFLYFYSVKDSTYNEDLRNLLNRFATQHDKDVVCFLINVDEFFKISELMAVDTTPMLSVINNKKELDRFTQCDDLDAVMHWLEQQLKTAYIIKSC